LYVNEYHLWVLVRRQDMTDFMDKVRQGINKGVTTVGVKSKEVLETSKLKGQISIYERNKKDALEELGNIVYVMFQKNDFDTERIKNKCEYITRFDSQIEDTLEEIKNVHIKSQEALGKPRVIKTCDCGGEIHEGVRFCTKCGKKVITDGDVS
jgi:NADH pyrophosphatase NudC (nudix superfamily)